MTLKHLYLAFYAYEPYFFFCLHTCGHSICISVQKYPVIILEMQSANGFLQFLNYCEI